LVSGYLRVDCVKPVDMMPIASATLSLISDTIDDTENGSNIHDDSNRANWQYSKATWTD
jgi:hypothetical protein